MIKSIRTVEMHDYPALNFIGVSTELNYLSHMVLQAMHLGGGRALSCSGLSNHSPFRRRKSLVVVRREFVRTRVNLPAAVVQAC